MRRRGRLPAAAMLAIGVIGACERQAEHPDSAKAPTTPADGTLRTYTTRGQIIMLPAADRPANQLQIHHEAIPTFVDRNGDATGMKQMTMPFPHLAPGVTLDGLAERDKVEFSFDVQWTRQPAYQITAITTLPPDTKLEWE